jgi:hypothetical protein
VSLSRHHARAMQPTRIDTFADFLKHNYELACFCPGCRRWASCDFVALVAAGMGDRQVRKSRPKCRKCGSRGEWQVRAPAPTLDSVGKQIWPTASASVLYLSAAAGTGVQELHQSRRWHCKEATL